MRQVFAFAFFLLGAPVFAQNMPFDMSNEKPADQTAQPGPVIPPLALPQAAPQAAVPTAPPKPVAPVQPQSPAAPPPTQAPQNAAPKTAQAPSAPKENASEPVKRYIVPSSKLELAGEFDRRQWTIYLTPEEARSQAVLNFAYQNAIVVAPEASQITVFINNRQIAQQRVSSPDGITPVHFDLPRGLLQSGVNLIAFEVNQRHRTDCTIQSTYDLWTTIDPSQTFLSFSNANAARWSSTDAIKAIGVDTTGATGFSFLVPALEQPATVKPLLRLSQGLSLLSGMPNENFSFGSSSLPSAAPGRMVILVGTVDEVQPFLPNIPAGARSGSFASFVSDPKGNGAILLISGPTWDAVSAAIEGIVGPADRPLDNRRTVLSTQRWSAPDVPLIFSANRVSLAELGVTTREFAGRRFRTNFNIAVPADFYANSYGEMTILLDAAYTEKVQPGSHIDVYVNGNIASTVPITSNDGGILRHLPIRVTMRHIKPGLNVMSMEAVLLTAEDKVCAPGATALPQPRFVLFDTTELAVPDFARIAQRPNLAAFAGTGYPYGQARTPVSIYFERVDPDVLSAAATMFAEMASASGRLVPVDIVSSPAAIGDRNAIFLGSIAQIPATVLSQLNISPAAQASWRPAAVADAQSNTAATFEEWRSKVSAGIWQGQVTAFEDWLRRNFDISLGSLHFLPSKEEVVTPSNAASFMLAQGSSPAGTGTWTLVTAPALPSLREGVQRLTTEQNWNEVAGRVVTYAEKTGKIETRPVATFDFVPTVPWSITNYRLILANWLSANILTYALLFVIFSVLTGIAASIMLSNLGRRK